MKLEEFLANFNYKCPKCGNDWEFAVILKNGRSGHIWNSPIIEDPEEALYLGDEWDEISEEEVELVYCPYCNETIYSED